MFSPLHIEPTRLNLASLLMASAWANGMDSGLRYGRKDGLASQAGKTPASPARLPKIRAQVSPFVTLTERALSV